MLPVACDFDACSASRRGRAQRRPRSLDLVRCLGRAGGCDIAACRRRRLLWPGRRLRQRCAAPFCGFAESLPRRRHRALCVNPTAPPTGLVRGSGHGRARQASRQVGDASAAARVHRQRAGGAAGGHAPHHAVQARPVRALPDRLFLGSSAHSECMIEGTHQDRRSDASPPPPPAAATASLGRAN